MKIIFFLLIISSAVFSEKLYINRCSEKWLTGLRAKTTGRIIGMSALSIIPIIGTVTGLHGIYTEARYGIKKSKAAYLLKSIRNMYILKNRPNEIDYEDKNRVQNFYNKYSQIHEVQDVSLEEVIKLLDKYDKYAYQNKKCNTLASNFKFSRRTIAKFLFQKGGINPNVIVAIKGYEEEKRKDKLINFVDLEY